MTTSHMFDGGAEPGLSRSVAQIVADAVPTNPLASKVNTSVAGWPMPRCAGV